MKITNISTYIYRPTWNWLFLKHECIELPTRPRLGVDLIEEALSSRPYVYHDLSSFWDTPQVPAGKLDTQSSQ